MFFSVIAAYVIATAFAFCGVVNAVGYISECERGMGSFLFIEGLAVTMWPLAVAMVLVMLVQIACKLERWMLLWTMAQAPAPSAPATAPARRAQEPAAKPRAPQQLPVITPPVLAEEAPQQPAAECCPIPLPPKPAPRQEKQAPAAQDGLNFFKID